MNMMSVLLGATGLLLVAALILSFGSMNGGADQKQIDILRAEINEINAAEQELALIRQTAALTTPPIASSLVAVQDANRQSALAAENAILREELTEIKEDAAELYKKADIYKEEAGIIAQRDLEKTDRESRRARIIQEALLIATVTEYSATDGFVVITIERPDSAQEGAKLAIRRNSGIIGQIVISSLYPNNQAVGDPIPGTFLGDNLDILPGDELILPPL